MDLPRLYPVSNSTRPQRKRRLPMSLRERVYFCIEYPDGVYIDANGHPDPSVHIDTKHTEDTELLPLDVVKKLTGPQKYEQLQLHSTLNAKLSHIPYYDDGEFVPDDTADGSSSSSDEDDLTDECESDDSDDASHSEEDDSCEDDIVAFENLDDDSDQTDEEEWNGCDDDDDVCENDDEEELPDAHEECTTTTTTTSTPIRKKQRIK